MCSKNLRKSVPANYIMLLIFTLSMAFMIASLTAWLTIASVLMAVGTLAITLTCLFAAALLVPAKPKILMGVLIAVFAACLI